MTDLIACLGTDSKLWEYAQKLIEGESWGNVFLICGDELANFNCKREIKKIIADTKQPLPLLISQIKKELDGKILDTEAAVNLTLGTGKEHMAVIAALLKLGLGIRLVAYTTEGVREI